MEFYCNFHSPTLFITDPETNHFSCWMLKQGMKGTPKLNKGNKPNFLRLIDVLNILLSRPKCFDKNKPITLVTGANFPAWPPSLKQHLTCKDILPHAFPSTSKSDMWLPETEQCACEEPSIACIHVTERGGIKLILLLCPSSQLQLLPPPCTSAAVNLSLSIALLMVHCFGPSPRVTLVAVGDRDMRL